MTPPSLGLERVEAFAVERCELVAPAPCEFFVAPVGCARPGFAPGHGRTRFLRRCARSGSSTRRASSSVVSSVRAIPST